MTYSIYRRVILAIYRLTVESLSHEAEGRGRVELVGRECLGQSGIWSRLDGELCQLFQKSFLDATALSWNAKLSDSRQ